MPEQEIAPTKDVVVSFLTSGPEFTVPIHVDMYSVPTLQSPIAYPRGGRACVFYPRHIVPPRFEPPEFIGLGTRIGTGGIEVEVFERLFEPTHWFLRWRVPKGTVETHVRDEDGEPMVDRVIDNLLVEATSSGLPVVLPSPPLARGASRAPGYQEEIAFQGRSEPGASIVLTRPGVLRAGESVEPTGYPEGTKRVGSGVGIDVATLACGEGLAEQIADRIREQMQLMTG